MTPVFSVLQMDDEDSILPRKLQVALEHILEQRNDLASEQDDGPPDGKRGKCSTTSQTAPLPPSLESGSSELWACPLDTGFSRKMGSEVHQERGWRSSPSAASCRKNLSHPTPSLALKNLFKGRKEMTGSLWGTSFMDHHSRPSRNLE